MTQTSSSSNCNFKGCTNETSYEKPYCISHINELSSAKEAAEFITAREREATLASGSPAEVNLGGLLAAEALQLIYREEPKDLHQIKSALDLDERPVKALVNAMVCEGFIVDDGEQFHITFDGNNIRERLIKLAQDSGRASVLPGTQLIRTLYID